MNKLMKENEAAEAFGLKARTLRDWRRRGKGPKWLKLEGSVRYNPEDIQRWIALQSGVEPKWLSDHAGLTKIARELAFDPKRDEWSDIHLGSWGAVAFYTEDDGRVRVRIYLEKNRVIEIDDLLVEQLNGEIASSPALVSIYRMEGQ